MFWTIFWTVIATTVAIIIAEIKLNYGLGDKVKDLFLSTEQKLALAKAKATALERKLAAELKATL